MVKGKGFCPRWDGGAVITDGRAAEAGLLTTVQKGARHCFERDVGYLFPPPARDTVRADGSASHLSTTILAGTPARGWSAVAPSCLASCHLFQTLLYKTKLLPVRDYPRVYPPHPPPLALPPYHLRSLTRLAPIAAFLRQLCPRLLYPSLRSGASRGVFAPPGR